jgi:hypothetical protein
MEIHIEMIDKVLTPEEFAECALAVEADPEAGDRVTRVTVEMPDEIAVAWRMHTREEGVTTYKEADIARIMGVDVARIGVDSDEYFVCGFNK